MPRPKPAPPIPDPLTDPANALHYVSDASLGIRRHRWRNSFHYTAPDGTPLHDPETLARIESLLLPPAWTLVWICPSPTGHLQATGRDKHGRKQSRFHPRWPALRDETRYARMPLFGQALPLIRTRIEHDLALPGLPREKVLANILRLFETPILPTGDPEPTLEARPHGLTTMRRRHIRFARGILTFDFQEKSGIHHTIDLRDRRLIKIVQQCWDIPGFELFQYLAPDGTRHAIDSADVNRYLHNITAESFTAKDFRTWAGTILAARLLRASDPFTSDAQAKKNVAQAIKQVALKLGHTPTVCRKHYIHPAVLASYLSGAIPTTNLEPQTGPSPALLVEERALMDLLEQHLTKVRS